MADEPERPGGDPPDDEGKGDGGEDVIEEVGEQDVLHVWVDASGPGNGTCAASSAPSASASALCCSGTCDGAN